MKGVEIGAGFGASHKGHRALRRDRGWPLRTNNAGGVLGGISTGQPITVNIAIRPTSSTRLDRVSIDKAGQPVTLNAWPPRPCVGIRATPIAEALLALVLIEHALRHRAQIRMWWWRHRRCADRPGYALHRPRRVLHAACRSL